MKKNKIRILVIEDEPDITELLQYNLEREGFTVLSTRDGDRGLSEAISQTPDLILLDLMLPGIDGIEVCRALKKRADTSHIPVIMLTAKGEESDKVLGLGIGADDYITKPFSPRELTARIRAVLRRSQKQETEPANHRIEFDGIVIDAERHEVKVREEPIYFTAAEFRILKALATRPGRVFTRDQLLEKLTGGETYVLDRNIDVHVGTIRKKLGIEGHRITTIRGVGYKFVETDG